MYVHLTNTNCKTCLLLTTSINDIALSPWKFHNNPIDGFDMD